MYQPTKALNKIQFMASIELQHVSSSLDTMYFAQSLWTRSLRITKIETYVFVYILHTDHKWLRGWIWSGYHIAVAQWLRCCSTNRKVAGSIPAGVIGIFHWHKILPIVLWPWVDSVTNRNEYQQHFLRQMYHHPVPLSWCLGTLTPWNPLGHSRPAMGLIYLFISQF